MAEELEQSQEEAIKPTQEQSVPEQQTTMPTEEQSVQEEQLTMPTEEQSAQPEQLAMPTQEQSQTQEVPKQPPSKANQLYNKLLSEGYTKENLGDEQTFTKNASSKAGADMLYSKLISDGYNDKNLGGKDFFISNLTPQAPVQPPVKYPKPEAFGLNSKNLYTTNRSDATYVVKPINMVEAKKQTQLHKEKVNQAIDNTTKKVLQKKGIKVVPNSPTYINEKKKLEDAVAEGNATYVMGKDGVPGLNQTVGFIDSFINALNESDRAATEANEFVNKMSTKERVAYVNRKKEEQSPYLGKTESLGGIVGKFGGEAVPFLAKATAGIVAGTGIIAAAPETFGASLLGLPTVLAFTLTAPDMINQGGANEVMRRYEMLKKANNKPNPTEEESEIMMKESEKGLTPGMIGGGVENLLFMGTGAAKPITNVAKDVFSNFLKQTMKSSAHMGAITAGVETGKEIEAAIENKKYKMSFDEGLDNFISNFGQGATTGAMLHVATQAITGAIKMPKALLSATKYTLAKENPAELGNILKANEEAGTVPPGTTEKVMVDLTNYRDALDKTTEGLTPDTQASVAGLIQSRDKLVTEMTGKDATQIQMYQDRIDALNEQIKKITETNNPFEYEINSTGQTLNGEVSETPIEKGVGFADINDIPEIAETISNLNNEISKGGEEAAKAQVELKKINEDPLGYYERLKQEYIDATSELPEEQTKSTIQAYDNIIKEINDTKNIGRIPSEIGVGKEPIKAQPIEGAGTEEVKAGGVVQESESGRATEVQGEEVKTPLSPEELQKAKELEAAKTNLPIDKIRAIDETTGFPIDENPDVIKAKQEAQISTGETKEETTKTKLSPEELQKAKELEAAKTNLPIDKIRAIDETTGFPIDVNPDVIKAKEEAGIKAELPKQTEVEAAKSKTSKDFEDVDFEKEYYQDKKKIKIKGEEYEFGRLNFKGEENVFIIEKNGSEIGRATLSKNGNYLENIRINEEYRRKGLASKMYNYIESQSNIKLEPSPIKQSEAAKKIWEKRRQVELPKEKSQNKDNQPEFTTSNGRQKINKVGDSLIVTDAKTGKEVSRKTYNKAIREYADNFDFTHGEEGESTTQSQDVNKILREVVEDSNNPHQIAQIYAENDVPFTETEMTKDGMIAEYGLGGMSLESYRRFGDINKLTKGIRANYFAKKGDISIDIDSQAKDISEHYYPNGDGTEISPQDIVEFMEQYDTRKKLDEKFASKNPLLVEAKDKFKKLTGLDLTKEIANKALEQKIEKESQAEQNLLKQDYENAKQFEDEYWKQYEATDGFTKEATAVEVDKGKEGATKKEEKVEVPLGENPFESVPKTQVARDKYFKSTFGENAEKAEQIYNEGGTAKEMNNKMQGEEVPPAKVPPAEKVPKEPLEEGWTAIRKEKLKEVDSIKNIFEKETSKSWTKIQQDALEDVAKEFPKKSLNDAIRTRVERLALKYDAKEDYNPTSKDLAVIQEFKRQTESKLNSAEKDLMSDNELDRQVAMMEIENYNNDLTNAGKALFTKEAGRAFGFRQSESKMDENAGLQVRRMEMMRANGGEKLSEADSKFVDDLWKKEKELMKKEQEIREQGLKDSFDKEISDLQKEYEAKLKIKENISSNVKQKSLSQKGKDVANIIRGLKLKGTKIDFTFGTWNIAVEGIAKLVEAGSTIAEAIDKLVKDGTIGFKTVNDRDALENEFVSALKNFSNRETSLNKIKELAAKDDLTNISNEMVSKGLVRDYINSFVGEVDKVDVLNKALEGLKDALPDIDKNNLRKAFLKQDEFKQPTKKALENSITQAKRDLLRVERQESFKESTETELQKRKLEQEKEKSKRELKEYQRKLDEGDYEKREPVVLAKEDAELIQLNKDKKEVESEFRRKQTELQEKNKHWIERTADFVRSSYIAALIGSPVTLAKVGYMSFIRPTSEATRKLTLGKAFDAIFPSISRAAEKGGESSSIKNLKKGFEAYFMQIGEKGMENKYKKSNDAYEQSAKKYYDALNSGANKKTLASLEADMNAKLIAAAGNTIYSFIGSSSIKDAMQSLVYRANEIEKQFGKTDIEKIDGKAITEAGGGSFLGMNMSNLNYILGFIGRSHSAAKTFSGRFSYASTFMSRLESAAKEGTLSDPNKIIEIAHESYMDWESGKYQQDNWVTKTWNNVLKSLKAKTSEKGEWAKYNKGLDALLKTDVAITRVPVNILHEMVAEYTLGAIRAPFMAYKEYAKAKKIAVDEGYSKMLDSKEFKTKIKDIVSKMDEQQAAKIYRLFTKGGLGIGLYALAAFSGMVQFGVFPHKGQKKVKEEEYLEEGELNPGQIMFGKDRLGETASKLIEHTPALWTTFMGLGISKIYADDVKKGKMSPQAAWDAIYTHMNVVESSIPQSKVFSPLQKVKELSKSFTGRLSKYGMFDDYIDGKGNFIDQEKKALEITTPQVARLKDYKVEPPRLGVRSQNKIEVDAKHPKVGLSKDGKPYAYMNDFEWNKFNEYRKAYVNEALSEVFMAADNEEVKLNKENLTDALIRITKQATSIAKFKLIDEGILPEKNEDEETDEDKETLNDIIRDLFEQAKP
jgi:hypothetical protein